MNPLKPRPLLRNKRIVLLFYEASTRTRSSFEIAAKSLGAITTLVQSSGSSIEKGESLLDTGYTLRAVGADAIVIRHPSAGAPHLMAKHLDIPVINAGDGMHEHPSQAARCLHHPEAQEIVQRPADRDHRRHLPQPRDPLQLPSADEVRREDHALRTAGVCARGAATLAPGCASPATSKKALRGADVIMLLRLQKERLAGQKFICRTTSRAIR
jgi:aspartate carbamoyltransferase catalytic subunit